MKNKSDLSNIIKCITMLSQLGLSILTPTLGCLWFCWWLTSRHGVGNWVYFLGFFFGMGGSFTVAYKFYKSIVQKENKEKSKKTKVGFNRHI